MSDFYTIQGDYFEDHRGKVTFANTFDMTAIKRFYILTHHNTHIVRGWQGHKNETKWFYCQNGSFLINIIRPLNIQFPTGEEQIDCVQLEAGDNKILCVPGGHFTGIKSEVAPSSLLIFSDCTLDISGLDDYRQAENFWTFKTEIL